MNRTAVALAALIALALPATASGQISVGARAGTMGLGGEVSFGFTRMLAVRGGVGFAPVEYSSDFSDVSYTVGAPDMMWNVGVDLYPLGGGLRISAGFFNRPAYDLTASGQQTADIGGRTYTGEYDIRGEVSNEKETAPYVGIGFGRATGRGVGLFVDLGAAFMGDARIQLSGTCTETSTGQPCPDGNPLTDDQAEFNARIQAEAQQAQEDVGEYLKIHPILQIGLRIGL